MPLRGADLAARPVPALLPGLTWDCWCTRCGAACTGRRCAQQIRQALFMTKRQTTPGHCTGRNCIRTSTPKILDLPLLSSSTNPLPRGLAHRAAPAERPMRMMLCSKSDRKTARGARVVILLPYGIVLFRCMHRQASISSRVRRADADPCGPANLRKLTIGVRQCVAPLSLSKHHVKWHE